MKALLFLLIGLSGCTALKSNNGDETFYTWVDERGMIHTQRKINTDNTKSEAADNTQAEPNITINKLAAENNTTTKKFEIIESDYTSSNEIDKKIAGEKLYSWTQDGRQITAELGVSAPKDTTDSKKITEFDFGRDKHYREFREGKEALLSELFSKEVKLEHYFNTTEKTNHDYLLIEIDIPDTTNLIFNSFTHNNKVALPRINVLSDTYLSAATISNLFDSYIKETWSSYGRFTGSLIVPAQAKYLLIRPNPTLGVIETEDGDFTLIDLGTIQITN